MVDTLVSPGFVGDSWEDNKKHNTWVGMQTPWLLSHWALSDSGVEGTRSGRKGNIFTHQPPRPRYCP